jgi:hypothetical protein
VNVKAKTENRTSERFNIGAPIKYVPASVAEVFKCEIMNCSADGIYFETVLALQPGTIIFLAAADDIRYFRAVVKRCEKLTHTGSMRFGIGAKYVDPSAI